MSDDDLVGEVLDSVVLLDGDTPTPQAEALGEWVVAQQARVEFPPPDLSSVSTLQLLDELRRRVLGGG